MRPNIRRRTRESDVPESDGQVTLFAGGHNWSAGLDLQIEYADINSLRRPAREPRAHSTKQIAQIEASIRTMGFINPIIVDGDRTIVAGVGRYLAACSMRLARVPVIAVEHLTAEQRRIFALADNKIAQNAQWDDSALAAELSDLSELDDLPIELTGFDGADIDKIILAACSLDACAAGDDDVDETPIHGPAVSQRGDLFIIGKHRLLCGDARDPADYARLMQGERARMACTDFPYNVAIAGNVSGLGKVKHGEFVMGCGEMSQTEFTAFLSDIMQQLVVHSIDGSIHFLCMDWRHQLEMMTAGEAHYAELKNLLVWVKTNAGMGTFYRSQHELIYAWKNGRAPHINNFGLGESGRYRTNVLSYEGANTFRRGRNEDLAAHSTVKPTLLIADLIRDVSKVGDIVLDACAGSGTTILAADRVKRRAYCLELDPKYVDVAVRRCEQRLGTQAIHEQSGLTFSALSEQRLAHPHPMGDAQ